VACVVCGVCGVCAWCGVWCVARVWRVVCGAWCGGVVCVGVACGVWRVVWWCGVVVWCGGVVCVGVCTSSRQSWSVSSRRRPIAVANRGFCVVCVWMVSCGDGCVVCAQVCVCVYVVMAGVQVVCRLGGGGVWCGGVWCGVCCFV